MQGEDDTSYLADGLVDLVDDFGDTLTDVGAIRRRLQVQPSGEEALDHTVVQLAGNAVAVVEHLESRSGLDESGGGLEPLADVAHRRHRCRDLTQFSAQRTERDLDGHFATRAMQRREQQTTAHRPRPRIVGVSLSMRGVPTVQTRGDQRLDRLAHQLLRRPADDLTAVVVRVPDEPVGVDHDDHLGNALEQHPRIQRGIGHPVVLSPDSHLHPRRGVVEVGDRATRRGRSRRWQRRFPVTPSCP